MEPSDAPTPNERAFARVAKAMAGERGVTHGGGKGFGANSLKVNGKIFAMVSAHDEFVVKLPKDRAATLVAEGKATYFDTGRGKIMKEWIVVPTDSLPWTRLAKEAYEYVRGIK
jgi:hypothetical protein